MTNYSLVPAFICLFLNMNENNINETKTISQSAVKEEEPLSFKLTTDGQNIVLDVHPNPIHKEKIKNQRTYIIGNIQVEYIIGNIQVEHVIGTMVKDHHNMALWAQDSPNVHQIFDIRKLIHSHVSPPVRKGLYAVTISIRYDYKQHDGQDAVWEQKKTIVVPLE